jgi:CheY-like chemotaxis protein
MTAAPIPAHWTGRFHALLAEDDADMRRLLKDLLEGLGARVTDVADGHRLVEVLEDATRGAPDGGYDLIVTDHRMPGALGARAVEVFRRYDASAPVLVVSAFADDELKARVRELGAADVLQKPFEPDELTARVERLLAAALSSPAQTEAEPG